jgi:hypothetical protein
MSITVHGTRMPGPRSSAGQLARNRRPAEGALPAGRRNVLTFPDGALVTDFSSSLLFRAKDGKATCRQKQP